MKKFMLVALAAVVAMTASAQKNQVNGPKKGDVSIEVLANPFSNNFSTFKLNGAKISGKYFITDNFALRAGLGLSIDGKSTDIDDREDLSSGGYQIKDGTEDNTYGEFGISFGAEYHFAQKSNLDLYLGAQINLDASWASYEKELTTTTYNNQDVKQSTSWSKKEYSGKDNRGNVNDFAFGLSLVTGANYYFTKNLYAGVELGLRINSASTGEWDEKENKTYTTHTSTGSNITTYDPIDTTHKTTDSNTEIGFYIEPALRLGWTF